MDVSEVACGVEAATSLSSLALPNSSADLAKSPSSSEFLGDEEARSTCPLLTPSPPAGTQLFASQIHHFNYFLYFIFLLKKQKIYAK
jgi:hypothetical protein